MNDSFVENLLANPEEDRIERFVEYSVHKVLAGVCALLNHVGGWIVIGISDSGQYIRLKDADKMMHDVSKAVCEKICPMPLVYAHIESYRGFPVLLVTVLPGSKQPYNYEGKFYVRIGGVCREPSADEISMLMRASNTMVSSWETSTCLACKQDDLRTDLIEDVMLKAKSSDRIKDYLVFNSDDFLSSLRLKDYESVKNGAVALFAADASNFLPQCKVRIQVMPLGKDADSYDALEIIEGNVFETLDRIRNFFKTKLPMTTIFRKDEWNREERLLYPDNVLDEAVVNALVHRDYSLMSGEVTIFIYSDKMEIMNPGIIAESILRDMKKGRPQMSLLRNPAMAEVLFMANLMEKTGRGMALILDEMRKEKCIKPEWKVLNGCTVLTLYPLNRKAPIGKRGTEFLRYKEKGDIFSRKNFEEFFKGEISPETAKKDIKKLVDAGYCSQKGSGRSTDYEVL